MDYLWRLWGIIDGINELHRKIASGAKNTADESMSSIRFQTTPEGGLTHYPYIFWNPEQLEIEVNNMVCSRLGTMLYLENG